MRIKKVKIDDIIIEDRAREDIGDIEGLMQSIKDKGLLQPISVTKDYKLLAGYRRLSACKELGNDTVMAVIQKSAGEMDAKEVELHENIYRKDFTWSERGDLEAQIFKLKKKEDPNWTQRDQVELIGGSKGATSRRLQLADAMEYIPELADCATEDEAWKKFKKIEEDLLTAVVIDKADKKYKTAIKYAEGHYMIGDAIQGLKEVNDGVVNFVEVDPPYAVRLEKRKGRNQDLKQMDAYNEVSSMDYPEFLNSVITECYRVMQPNSFMIWWFGPEWYQTVRDILMFEDWDGKKIKIRFKVGVIPAIWTKSQPGQTASPDTMLGSSYEPFFVCRKGSPKLRKPGRSNVFEYKPVPPQHKVHPTERPIELMNEIMDTFVMPGSTVCIPFLGSGVTLRAVYNNRSTGYGWDLDEMTKSRFINQVFKDMQEREEE